MTKNPFPGPVINCPLPRDRSLIALVARFGVEHSLLFVGANAAVRAYFSSSSLPPRFQPIERIGTHFLFARHLDSETWS